MELPFLAPRRPSHWVVLLLLTLADLPGCKKSPSKLSCPAPPEEGGLQPSQSGGDGTVAGSGVSASFCNVAVFTTGNGSPFFLVVNSAPSSSSVGSPASGVQATLTGSIEIGSATPGVYRSSSASVCDSLVFSYGVPLATEAECAAADAQGACPKGCTANPYCASYPCCIPLATTFVFQANGAEEDSAVVSCGTNQMQDMPLGSWTVTLTSVVDEDAGGGQLALVPHGSLNAMLQGISGNDETVSLSLTF